MLQNYVISSDSTCDLPENLVKENGISINPLVITLGGKQYLDGVTIDAETILKHVENGGDFPKTSAVTPEEYREYFEKLTKDGAGVIHFCISGENSCCFNNALLTSKDFENVYVVDSRQLSTGQGLLVLKACDYKKQGFSLKECYDKIEEIKGEARTSFVLDRLDFMHKGGRCNVATLIAAKILKIHPHISQIDGNLKVTHKYMGRMLRACSQYVETLAREFPSYDKTRAFVTSCNADQAIIDVVKQKAKELFSFDVIEESYAGGTVASHCGRNTIGLLFITE